MSKTIRLPGYKSDFGLYSPILPGGNFYWYEATKYGARIPENKSIVDAILSFAGRLERARDMIGEPMIITSWYRPPDVNAAVGGVPNSPHLSGRAVDFYCESKDWRQIYYLLNSTWQGGMGSYSSTGHTHLDDFGYRRW